MTRHDEILVRFAQIARPEILKVARRDSCIFSTRVTIEVLKKFGIRARALPVQVQLVNAAWLEAERVKHEKDLDRQAFTELTARTRAWSVGVGSGYRRENPRAYNAHLIAVTDTGWLVDASLDQASRPHRGLEVPGVLLADLREAADDLRRGIMTQFANSRGWVVRYTKKIEALGYLYSGDWTKRRRWSPTVDRIIAGMELGG